MKKEGEQERRGWQALQTSVCTGSEAFLPRQLGGRRRSTCSRDVNFAHLFLFQMSLEEREQARAEAEAAARHEAATMSAFNEDYERAYQMYQASLARDVPFPSGEPIEARAARPPYQFHQPNPFMESANPYEEGVALYAAGKLQEAILAFEAAIQQQERAQTAKQWDLSNCWRLLGTCYAENDDDSNAILALLKAVDADHSNLEALLELGVSFTNEVEESEALKFLYSWLQHHPDFKHVPGDQPIDLKHITGMFVRASEFVPKVKK